MESLLRAHDVAQLLNVRPSTVYALAHRGFLPHVRIAQGTKRALIRFKPEEIEQLIRERAVHTKPVRQ